MRAFLFYIDDYLSSGKVQMMDAHEERGYVRLLLRAASEPTCSLPDDNAQLAVCSLLGSQWNKPTKDHAFRVATQTSGEKLRGCFTFRPEGALEGRLYNGRMYREFLHQQKVNEERKRSGLMGGRPRKNQTVIPKEPNGSVEETIRQSKTKANGKENKTNDVCVYVSSSGFKFSENEEEAKKQMVSLLRDLWQRGGLPWNFADENAVTVFENRPTRICFNILAFAERAFTEGYWPNPTKTKRFWRFLDEGTGESGAPARTLSQAPRADGYYTGPGPEGV